MLHKDRKLFVRGQGQRVAWHESWRNIARRTLLFFVVLLIIILAIEVMCVHSSDPPVAGQ